MNLKTAVERFKIPFALSLSKGERDFESHPMGERRKNRSCFDKLSTNGFFCVLTAVFRMKRFPATCLAALAMAAGAAQAAPAEKAAPAIFMVLEQGSRSGVSIQQFGTIRDKASLRALWQQHGKGASPPQAMPEVDFSKEMVVAAFAGQKSTGGYQLNLTGLNRRGGQLSISFSLTQPGPDCIVTQALTQPYVIVKIAQSNKPVNFQLAARTFSCVTGNLL